MPTQEELKREFEAIDARLSVLERQVGIRPMDEEFASLGIDPPDEPDADKQSTPQ